MWTVLALIVVFALGFFVGKMRMVGKFGRWYQSLPEDYRDVVNGAFHERPWFKRY